MSDAAMVRTAVASAMDGLPINPCTDKAFAFQPGEGNPNALLDSIAVLSIYAAKGQHRAKALAQQYKVSRACIYSIWGGKSWGHLTKHGQT